MKTFRRKIQIVGGTTYTLSLPKEWVRSQHLKEQDELLLALYNDSSIRILPVEGENGHPEKISISFDSHPQTIDQLILSAYYYGYETITVVSKKEIDATARRRIRKILVNLSGTEIVTEDEKEIVIKIMLDKLKVNILQTFYRIALILEMSVDALVDTLEWQEIKLNEDEIDRLYHLTVKIISTALSDANILESSGIGQINTIPSLFLIAKRLENIGDNIKHIARIKREEKIKLPKSGRELLELLSLELKRTTKHLLGKQNKSFLPLDKETYYELKDSITAMQHKGLQTLFSETLRYLQNIEEEVVTIGFYLYMEGMND